MDNNFINALGEKVASSIKREKWTTINPAIEPISDAEKAKRYRRKLEDLSKAANDLLLTFNYYPMSEEQKPLAKALADEVTLIYSQMIAESEITWQSESVKEQMPDG